MNNPRLTARAAGAGYLGLAVTGMLGFLVIRAQLIDLDDPAATLANLQERTELAHLLVGLEMGIVLTQAIAAIFFYKLYRPFAPVAGFGVATLGLMNSAAIMASGAFMATANAVAGNTDLAPGGDPAATVGLLYELSQSSWGMGNLFFGLWLIPMGWAAITTGRFPKVMGWILSVGGAGYVLSGLLGYGAADAPGWLVESLAFPATVGEFWMIAYLLSYGVRPDGHRGVVPGTPSLAEGAPTHRAPSVTA